MRGCGQGPVPNHEARRATPNRAKATRPIAPRFKAPRGANLLFGVSELRAAVLGADDSQGPRSRWWFAGVAAAGFLLFCARAAFRVAKVRGFRRGKGPSKSNRSYDPGGRRRGRGAGP